MVVQAPLLAALAGPRAHVTVIDWLGVVRRRDNRVVLSDRLLHLRADQPEVGGVVVHAVCVDRRVRVWRDDVEVLGRPALRDAEHLGVQTELQDGAGASLARELRVGDFIRPRAETARRLRPAASHPAGRTTGHPLRAAWTITSTPHRIASRVSAIAAARLFDIREIDAAQACGME